MIRGLLTRSLWMIITAFSMSAVHIGFGQTIPQGRFAVVDMERVSREYHNSRSQKLYQDLKAQVNRRTEMPFLTQAEHERLDTILSKPASRHTQQEKRELQELRAKSTRLSLDYATAQSRASSEDASEEDKQNLRKLDELVAEANKRAEAHEKAEDKRITTIFDKEPDKTLAAIRSAIKKVAQSKRIDIVLNAREIVVHGSDTSIDITDDVIAQLKKRR